MVNILPHVRSRMVVYWCGRNIFIASINYLLIFCGWILKGVIKGVFQISKNFKLTRVELFSAKKQQKFPS
jgi:hypothetical protein